ncbi:MAG: ABA4-like family protein [Hyphomicrobiaceae bacterium]
MDADLAFQIANAVALWGWIALLASPLMPLWSDRIATYLIPALLSAAYAALVVLFFRGAEGGYFTLDDVMRLFARKEVVLAGWLHVLAFDLFVGAWIIRTARQDGIPFLRAALCLPLAFLFGPAGLLAYFGVRWLTLGRVA